MYPELTRCSRASIWIFRLVNTTDRRIDPKHGNVDHLHNRVNHLRDGRMLHLPSDLVHAPCCTVQGNLLRELEHKEFIITVQSEIGPKDIFYILQAEPLKTPAVIFGKFSPPPSSLSG